MHFLADSSFRAEIRALRLKFEKSQSTPTGMNTWGESGDGCSRMAPGPEPSRSPVRALHSSVSSRYVGNHELDVPSAASGQSHRFSFVSAGVAGALRMASNALHSHLVEFIRMLSWRSLASGLRVFADTTQPDSVDTKKYWYFGRVALTAKPMRASSARPL